MNMHAGRPDVAASFLPEKKPAPSPRRPRRALKLIRRTATWLLVLSGVGYFISRISPIVLAVLAGIAIAFVAVMVWGAVRSLDDVNPYSKI